MFTKKCLSLLCALALMLALLPASALGVSPMHTLDFSDDEQSEDFYFALADLINAQRDSDGFIHAESNDPYASARLLVFAADDLNLSGFDTLAAIYDGCGMWIIQFSSPEEAYDAELLLATIGIFSEPDSIMTCEMLDDEDDGLMTAAAAGHLSWGVSDCGFDWFVQRYGASFTGSEIVAVVDSGVDASHNFLRGRVLQGIDLVDGDDDAFDEFYHGTLVASVVVDCLIGTPVSILPIRIFDANGVGYSSEVAEGVKYAASHGADVINLSLGGDHDEAVDQAIRYAIDCGATVCIAAGNENQNTANCCPAHIQVAGAVVVGSANSTHNKAGHSNFGASMAFLAPGVSIKGAIPGNKYKTTGGTSLAAPHAAAAAALLDLVWGKNLSPAQLDQKLLTATSNNGSRVNDYVGCGFLNMRNADVPQADPPSYAPIADGTYYIEAYCGKIVEVADSRKNDGANVQIWQKSGRDLGCQKWEVKASNGGYVLTAVHSGKALDVKDGSSKSGTNIQTWHVNNTKAQTFFFEDAGGGYVFIKSALGTYLDVYGNKTANGTNVQAYIGNASYAQRFKLVPVTDGTEHTGGYYQYRYACWIGSNGNHSYCNVAAEEYCGGGPVRIQYTEWSTTRFVKTNTKWTCGHNDSGKHQHEGTGGYLASDTGNRVWYLYSPDGSTSTKNGYFWEEVRWVEGS